MLLPYKTILLKAKIVFVSLMVLVFCFDTNKANAQATATCGAVVSFMPLNTCATNVAISDPTNDYPALPAAACLNGGTFRREGWLGFTVPAGPNQNVTITATLASTTQNLGIEAFSACNAANIINCANAIPVGTASCEALALPNLAPGNYYFRLLNLLAGGSNITVAKLCVNTTPVNDDCSGAITLTPAAASAPCSNYNASTAGATQSLPANLGCSLTSANSANDDVWFTFFATTTTHVITVTPSVNFNAVFEVYTSSCGGTSINCTNVNNSGGQPEISTLTGLSIGTQYWIRVFDNGSNASGIPLTSTFDICIQTPPANDNCPNAIVLTPSASCVGVSGNVGVASNSGIAVSAGCPTSNPDDDVWYTFTATGTSHTISVTGSASFDPGFEVFTGPCGALSSVICNAPGGVPGTTITTILTPTVIGTQYWVRVYDYGVAYPGTTTFTICVLNPPPANDDCAGAVALSPLSTTCVAGSNQQTGNVSGATQSMIGCTGNANDDVWYSFTTNGTASQPYLVSASGNGTFDPVIQVFSGTCAGLVSLACINANSGGGTSESTTLTTGIQLTASTTYYIRVYDANSGYPSNTTFSVCVTIPPLSDNCPGLTIGVYGNNTTPALCGISTGGNALGATASGLPATCGGSPSADVFYNFFATSTSHIVTVTACANFNPVIQVYSGSCGGTSINCTNAGGNGATETAYLSGLTIGAQYWVRIYDFNGVSACTNYSICVSTPPINDPCTAAITLTPNTSCTNVSGSVLNGTQSFPANCGGTVTSDVWYKFTAVQSSQTVTVTASGGINIVYELFSSNPCGGAGTSLGCINAGGVGVSETNNWTGLTAGAQYWIRVYDFSGAPSTFTFAICVISPNILANDCINAYNICTNFTFSISPVGPGSVADLPAVGTMGNPQYIAGDGVFSPWGTDHQGCLQSGEINPTWWLVNISGTGTLEFTMGVGTQAGFTDWVMYPYTTCGAIAANTVAPIRCNWNATPSGGTGCVATIPGGGNAQNYEPPIAVTAGQQYVICFTNWSGLTTTVPLVFGGSASVTCAPLPIELTSFTGEKLRDGVNLLKWTTATETNNDYFRIERSADAVNWENIGMVQGAGTSYSQLNYALKDYTPPNMINYYRLVQVDYDGHWVPSGIVSINNSFQTSGIMRITNMMGQDVPVDYEGMRLIYYKDGTVVKKLGK